MPCVESVSSKQQAGGTVKEVKRPGGAVRETPTPPPPIPPTAGHAVLHYAAGIGSRARLALRAQPNPRAYTTPPTPRSGPLFLTLIDSAGYGPFQSLPRRPSADGVRRHTAMSGRVLAHGCRRERGWGGGGGRAGRSRCGEALLLCTASLEGEEGRGVEPRETRFRPCPRDLYALHRCFVPSVILQR